MNPPFILVAITTAKMCRILVEKMAKKSHFFTFFGVTRQNFLGSRWNISTNEPVLERLLNFWIFGTFFKLIAHLVWAREPPKAKKSEIRVTRKPDLETQNWVYSFSSFIEPYQTHIVTVQMLSTFFHLLDRELVEFNNLCKSGLWVKIRWADTEIIKFFCHNLQKNLKFDPWKCTYQYFSILLIFHVNRLLPSDNDFQFFRSSSISTLTFKKSFL